ncbi:DNA primase [Parapedomonas caeni]
MTISPVFLDEIRARVPLSTVVGRKVRLVRAGREFKACCPFHNEKSPSFYVNDEKAFYHCFGCGAHGDVIRFLCEAEGRSFREAVEQLAAEAGLEMPRESPEDRVRAERLGGLVEVMTAAQAWFAEQLQGIAGGEARSYVERRGLRPETVRRFGLGFAPDRRDGLKTALLAKGASEALLIEAGLLIAVDDKTPYDRFRGRLMFPIRDGRGRVIAFGGRILGDGQPKYLNSPDTPLFDKGRTLYNIDLASGPARKSERLLVVEGYMDVIALAQAGFEAAVAPLGTALTEDHIQRLWRLVPEPLLCFDGDAAGQRAALRAALRALPLLEPGKSLRFVTLPAGQDPDDLVKSSGAPALERLLEGAQPLVDLLWQSEVQAASLATPEGRAALRQTLLNRTGDIAHGTVQSLYRQELLERFDQLVGRNGARNPRAGGQWGSGPRGGYRASQPRVLAGTKLLVERNLTPALPPAIVDALVVGLLEHPDWLDRHHEELERLTIDDPELARLWARMLDESIHDPCLDKARLDNTLASEGFERLVATIRARPKPKFTFTRTGLDPARCERDFSLVLQSVTRINALDTECGEAAATYRANQNEDDWYRLQRITQDRELARRELADLANALDA